MTDLRRLDSYSLGYHAYLRLRDRSDFPSCSVKYRNRERKRKKGKKQEVQK